MDAMLTMAHRMGINGLRDPARYGLSVTLGGGEVNLLDLTYAYAPFANNGMQNGQPLAEADRNPTSRQFEPVAILEIRRADGALLYQKQPTDPVPIVDAGQAYLITDILSDDEARAETFGLNSPLKLSRPAAAKTGTTDDYRDSWVIGYTPDLVTGVWVGNSDGTPMRDVVSAQAAGAIWHEYMEDALAGVPPHPFNRPANVITREVCKLSGLLPTPECPEKIQASFVPEDFPNRPDDLYRREDVCKVNGKLATDLVPANARESRVYVVFSPPDTDWGPRNGYPAPPAQRCDDVYKGVKVAEIDAPNPETPVSGTVQVIGSAMLDDFHHLDLEVGAGPNPTVWSKITDGRTEGVDRALLGVWDTSRFPPGRYTLRLAVYDAFGNSIQRQSPVTVGGAAPTPTPVRSPAPLAPGLIPPLFGATPAPQPAGEQPPSGQQPPVIGPTPALAPRAPTSAPTPNQAPVPRFVPPIGQPPPTPQATATPRRR